jgi:hypothetical protein
MQAPGEEREHFQRRLNKTCIIFPTSTSTGQHACSSAKISFPKIDAHVSRVHEKTANHVPSWPCCVVHFHSNFIIERQGRRNPSQQNRDWVTTPHGHQAERERGREEYWVLANHACTRKCQKRDQCRENAGSWGETRVKHTIAQYSS